MSLLGFFKSFSSPEDIKMAEIYEAYTYAIAGLGISCFIAGMLPRLVPFHVHVSRSLFLSFWLCFGAGILLATAMVHILPEISEKIPTISSIVFCLGFLLLFFIDELVRFCCFPVTKNGEYEDLDPLLNGTSHHQYGSVSRQTEGELAYSYDECDRNTLSSGSSNESSHTAVRKQNQNSPTVSTSSDDYLSSHCHSGSSTGHFKLLAALSLHSLLEGSIIGVQHKPTEIIFLTSVVASHKLIVSLCLGMELAAQYSSFKSHLIAIAVFVAGSLIGILIGMISHIKNSVSNDTLFMLQGIAGGSLLYVTVCEVLPRETARWQTVRGAGLVQFVATSIGFAFLVYVNTFLQH